MNIYLYILNKYEKYYNFVNEMGALLYYNYDLLLCKDTINNIKNIDEYINSDNCFKYSDLPDIFKEYIKEHYEQYQLGTIIRDNNMLVIKQQMSDPWSYQVYNDIVQFLKT
jgi:hypothetical protein